MILNCFKYLDYREVLREEVRERKEAGERVSFHDLAKAVRVQPPYVSKVMSGSAHLNRDQLFLALRFVEASSDETSYIEILHEYQTSDVDVRRRDLLARVKGIQAEHLDTRHHLERAKSLDSIDFDEYYLDPINQIVHVCLSIKRYRRAPDALARDLMIPLERVRSALKSLERLGALKADGSGGHEPIGEPLHLGRDSRLYGAWDAQLRQMAAVRRQMLPSSLSYGFSVVFSADEKTRRAIQERLLELVGTLQPLVGAAAENETYQLSLDLFSWTRQTL